MEQQRYIVAVSGGVDSMVLLDVMAQRYTASHLVVAHFDHGIRPDSQRDAECVREAAKRYDIAFEMRREELGERASEALARDRRYAFLRELAEKYQATIVTAHHLDDLVETIAINLTRGTGWRGLAVLDSDVERPLIDKEKSELITYAKTHRIAWREDATNHTEKYLRNRLRRRFLALNANDRAEIKREIQSLHAQQVALKHEIEAEVVRLIGGGPSYSRYFFTQLPPTVALECLRAVTHGMLTRPQLQRALHAIKVAKSGAVCEVGNGITIHFSTRHFSL